MFYRLIKIYILQAFEPNLGMRKLVLSVLKWLIQSGIFEAKLIQSVEIHMHLFFKILLLSFDWYICGDF